MVSEGVETAQNNAAPVASLDLGEFGVRPEKGNRRTANADGHRTIRTTQRARAFLDALAHGYPIGTSARAAGIGRTTVYAWREDDENFAAAWDAAVEAGTDVYEAELRRRALEGVQEPVYQRGELVGHIPRYSDRLLELALRSRRPGVYRDTVQHQHTGTVTVDFAARLREVNSAREIEGEAIPVDSEPS